MNKKIKLIAPLAILVSFCAVLLNPLNAEAKTLKATFPAVSGCPAGWSIIEYNRVGEYKVCTLEIKDGSGSSSSASKAKNHERLRDVQATVDNSTPEAPAADNPAPEVVSSSNLTSKPAVGTQKPEVNIVVFTYVKNGSTKKRIGGVTIKIERKGGNEKCDNRKKTVAKTNGTTKLNGKLVKGTVHFLGCTSGDYTVTALGRDKYKVISDSTRTVSLEQADRTAKVHFILEKIKKS